MSYGGRYRGYGSNAVSGDKPKKKWNPNWGKKAAPIVRVPRKTDCVWSTYQSDIFDVVAKGNDNVVVDAVPGSGKTTTITESLYHLPSGLDTVFLAFNKSIATELVARVPEGVEVRTTHAMGLKVITHAYGRVEIDNDKGMRIATAIIGPEDEKAEERFNLAKAIGLCKGYLAHTSNDIDAVLDKHGLDVGERKTFIDNVMKGLDTAAQQKKIIDFDEMIWFPSRHNLTFPQTYDRAFIDETQDLAPVQLDMLMRMVRPGGKTICVGDPRQSIYTFRGADSAAMENITTRTNAKTLPLSVCYRCAKSIVALAATIEPKIEACSTAEEGVVESVGEQRMIKEAAPGDFILSRTNSPLIGYCLSFLKEGRKANIQGRDVGRNLTWMIKKSGTTSVSEFLSWVDNWKATECERLTAKNRDCTHIADKADCFYAFAEGAHTLDDIKTNIEKMFDDTDDKNRIILSTTHRAKGLERDRCWVLNKTYKPSRGIEEANLTYVAYTRARKVLMLVE